MTPKEKAHELLEKHFTALLLDSFKDSNTKEAKRHTLISVNEIIEDNKFLNTKLSPLITRKLKYWQEVKQEIEKL